MVLEIVFFGLRVVGALLLVLDWEDVRLTICKSTRARVAP